MKNRYLIFLIFFCTLNADAQYVKFVTSGTITYEKRANMYALIKKSMTKNNEAYISKSFEQYTKTQPQFKTLQSTLIFTDNRTLYTPEETAATTDRTFFLPAFEQNNIVFTDLLNRQSCAQKKIFEKVFIIKDSVRNIKWKITDETRNIAGYECRRANALIMDSVYVVAFYTDEIISPGGPESFTGLPGMILGLALPHEHITWFATKVIDTSVPAKEMVVPNKGIAMNKTAFKANLETHLKAYKDLIKMALKFYLL